MVAEFPLAALQKIPFLKSPLDPKHAIVTLQFFVDKQWHCWLPHGDKLVKMSMWPVEANYFGDRPERDTDQCFELLHMIAQRTLGAEMYRSFHAMWNDFQGLSASLAKMRLYHANRDNDEYGIRRFVQSEIEYLTILCRSVFDLLQELVRLHVARIHVPDGPQPQELPTSFRDVVHKNKQDLSVDEIVARYDLLRPIAEWYVRHRAFFMQLRSIRDRIVHRGSTVEMVFSTNRGFAVSRDNDPFNGLYAWPSDCELPNGLVPIRPVLATMIKNTLSACDDFAATLSSSIAMPENLAPNLNLYSRGINDREFGALEDSIAHLHWDDA
jgi:hypothetical protein